MTNDTSTALWSGPPPVEQRQDVRTTRYLGQTYDVFRDALGRWWGVCAGDWTIANSPEAAAEFCEFTIDDDLE